MKTDSNAIDPLEVCTLPAEELDERLAWIRAELLPFAVASERCENGIRVEFAVGAEAGAESGTEVAAKLETLVALERECCSEIEFRLGPVAKNGRRRLEIIGVDPNAAIFANLVGPQIAETRIVARLAKSVGFGTALSVFVCCVLPLAIAGVIGASAAKGLARLDHPLPIAIAGLLFAGVFFVWQTRRRAALDAPRPTSVACGKDC
jgi:hypothetical protein